MVRAEKIFTLLLSIWITLPTQVLVATQFFPSSLSPQADVQFLFSAHVGREDGLWVRQTLLQLLQDRRPGKCVVWVEHAQPVGLPPSLEKLDQVVGSQKRSSWNWYQELTRRDLAPQVLYFLKHIFKEAQKAEGNPLYYFDQATDAFSAEIRRGIEDARRQGWQVEVRIEQAPFESYLRLFQRDAFGRLVLYWLIKQDTGKALAALEASYRVFEESLKLRDRETLALLDKAVEEDPFAVHVVICGVAHTVTMMGLIHRRNFRVQVHQQDQPRSDIHTFLLAHRQLPTVRSRVGQNFLLMKLDRLYSAFFPDFLPERKGTMGLCTYKKGLDEVPAKTFKHGDWLWVKR